MKFSETNVTYDDKSSQSPRLHSFSEKQFFVKTTGGEFVPQLVVLGLNICLKMNKMNKIDHKILLNEDTSMPKFHLKQQRFPYSTCIPFTKLRLKRIEIFAKTGTSKHLYRNELDQAYFAHDVFS